jgi:hypothetical protein
MSLLVRSRFVDTYHMESDLIVLGKANFGKIMTGEAETLWLMKEVLEKRRELHYIVAEWFLVNPSYAFQFATSSIVNVLLTQSWGRTEVKKLAGVFIAHWERGIVVREPGTQKRYIMARDCHNFVAGRLLRDPRYVRLRPTLYQFSEEIAAVFDDAAKRFPELEEAVKVAKEAEVLWV